ncbi:thiamine pyrophosphate-binding protein [Streptomyces sp. NPDC096080]|uniref:thiamine pyrophosphate-binding protein n=1 Tax=Streptomyces sp. NPDC096080 TaxID=3156693 RepID=UPI00331E2A4D
MRYHQALARALHQADVNTVFGVLGDANLFAMDSYVREQGGRFLSFSHEGGAVLAAAGYTATSGKLGVATVTHGPALTNTVTALVDASRSRTPLLLIAGDTAAADRDNLQNIDQASIVLPTGALFETVRSADTVAADVYGAISRARSARLPVVLNVPVDLQWAEAPDTVPPFIPTPVRSAAAPDLAELDEALGLLASARRPIVLAGRGAAGARDALDELAAVLGAPVATSLRGKGLFAGHPYDLGVYGTLAHDIAGETIARADCVLAVGVALNAWTTSKGELTAGRRVVHIDNDPTALTRAIGATVSVLGDAEATTRALTRSLIEAETEPTGFASRELAAALGEYRDRGARPAPTEGIDVELALAQIDAAVPADRTLVIDDGRFIITAYRELTVQHPSAYVHTCSFASIGLAVASAAGAHTGRPDRPVLVVCGDGGFMSAGLTEFSTLVRHGIDAVVVVMNDSAYGAEHMQFRARGMDPAISTFDWPDLAPVAEALGGIGHTVTDHAGLAAALASLPGRDRPVLIDVKIDPDRVPTPGY